MGQGRAGSSRGTPLRPDRAFGLPGDVGHDTIKAAYKDGVLEVTIAKLPEAKAVQVEVAYSS